MSAPWRGEGGRLLGGEVLEGGGGGGRDIDGNQGSTTLSKKALADLSETGNPESGGGTRREGNT